MIPPQAFAPSTACDADPRCRHAACFQIHLEASQPQQADRQALACAYHVADVIEALRGWAREHDLAGGQLTILAIEPATDGRQSAEPAGPGAADRSDRHGFAFSTIPLTACRLDAEAAPGSNRAEPES